MDNSNTKMNRGCTVPVKGPVTQDPKKYVFGLTPPRHLTGGLLSSWLVNQQFSRDGCKWTPLYSFHPRKLGSHVATLLPVHGPGMVQVSWVCKRVRTLCRKVSTQQECECRLWTHLIEFKWGHTVVVSQLPVTNTHARRTWIGHLSHSNRLPSLIRIKTHIEPKLALTNVPKKKRQWTLMKVRLYNSHDPSRNQRTTTKPGVARKGNAQRGKKKQNFLK